MIAQSGLRQGSVLFGGDERRWRWLLCGAIMAYYSAVAAHPVLLRLLGLNFEYIWFLGSHALLAASDAAAAGLDPYAPNPMDILGRPHVYSGIWLHLADLGLTREDNFVLGGFFTAVFFAAVVWWLRPRWSLPQGRIGGGSGVRL